MSELNNQIQDMQNELLVAKEEKKITPAQPEEEKFQEYHVMKKTNRLFFLKPRIHNFINGMPLIAFILLR